MNLLVILLILAQVPLAKPAPAAAVAQVTALTIDGQPFANGANVEVNKTHRIAAQTANTASVVFNRDGAPAKTDTSAPFDFSWTPKNVGAHKITATPRTSSGAIGTVYQVNCNAVAWSPTPSPTPSPSPSPTISSTPTPSPATPTPTASPTATPPTPSPSATPTSTPTPSGTPTPSASPSPSSSPNVAYVTVTVQWQATKDDRYTILYGTTNPPDIQADGGIAVRDGDMTLAIASLQPNTTYYFSDIVTKPTGAESQPLPPVQYGTTTTANQLFRMH